MQPSCQIWPSGTANEKIFFLRQNVLMPDFSGDRAKERDLVVPAFSWN